MSRGGFQGGVGRGRDPLLAKTVTITSGPYKGYIGIVKDIYNEWARVELHTNSKLVKVERNSLQLPGDVSVRRTNNSYYGNRFDGGRTPMFGGSKTPMHRGDGGMTPNAYAESGRTPAWNPGSRTPAWEAGSRTPAWETGSRTPGHNPGGRTPAWEAGSRTPAWETGSRTPGYNPGSRTPAWEAGSRTPAHSRAPDLSKFTGVRTGTLCYIADLFR
jgi:transcription elongation factor SPT5